MSERPWLSVDEQQADTLTLGGDWQLVHLSELDRAVDAFRQRASHLDASRIGRLDASGALLLLKLASRLGIDADTIRLKSEHQALLETVQSSPSTAGDDFKRLPAWTRGLAAIGAAVTAQVEQILRLIGFLGLTLQTALKALPRPSSWKLTSVVHHMQQTGLGALPLVVLLSFLVGAVVAFLGATVLRDFGAELFVVDLTVIAFLREMGVLLTAILLAGRTASAFTAQIGTMKSREEIDAIRTIGLDPVVLLVLPRLVALLIMLPILTVFAMAAGLGGGLVVSATVLDIPAELYFSRMQEVVQLRHYLVGLIKAPLFAVVIALVGCLEGFKVGGTAQSVGERTTSAVVQSISLVIVINAAAAVFFMQIGW
ncbi:MAG: MlaE family ABC transporter permease [Wenzhouxiangella sp.]